MTDTYSHEFTLAPSRSPSPPLQSNESRRTSSSDESGSIERIQQEIDTHLSSATPSAPTDNAVIPKEEPSTRTKRLVRNISQNVRRAFKQNLVPGLVLQAFALTILILYFTVSPFHSFFDSIGDLKQKASFGFSAASTCLFGGLVPFVFVIVQNRKTDPRFRDTSFLLRRLAFLIVYWSYCGVETDLFFRLQTLLYGEQMDAPSIAKKVATDQTIYTMCWTIFRQIFPYRWMELDFPSFSAFKQKTPLDTLVVAYFSTLFSVWMIWGPCMIIIYSLPSTLQVPLFELVLLFWVLILTFLSSKQQSSSEAESNHPHIESTAASDHRPRSPSSELGPAPDLSVTVVDTESPNESPRDSTTTSDDATNHV